MLFSEPTEPTAASASLPAKRPTTMVSAALKRSCKMPDSMIGSEKNSTLVRREPSVISMVRCACDLNISVSCTSKPKKKKHTQLIIAQIRKKLREVWIIVKNTKKKPRAGRDGEQKAIFPRRGKNRPRL